MAVDLKQRKVVAAKKERAKKSMVDDVSRAQKMAERFGVGDKDTGKRAVAAKWKDDTNREYNKARNRRETYGPTGQGAKAREKRLEGKSL